LGQSELIGKYLKVNIEIKRASEIPEKYTYKTQARYEWFDEDKTKHETKIVERSKTPDFSYKNSHMI